MKLTRAAGRWNCSGDHCDFQPSRPCSNAAHKQCRTSSRPATDRSPFDNQSPRERLLLVRCVAPPLNLRDQIRGRPAGDAAVGASVAGGRWGCIGTDAGTNRSGSESRSPCHLHCTGLRSRRSLTSHCTTKRRAVLVACQLADAEYSPCGSVSDGGICCSSCHALPNM
jgi:hypothetical protein